MRIINKIKTFTTVNVLDYVIVVRSSLIAQSGGLTANVDVSGSFLLFCLCLFICLFVVCVCLFVCLFVFYTIFSTR